MIRNMLAAAVLAMATTGATPAPAQTTPSYAEGSAKAMFGDARRSVFYDDTLAAQFEDAMSGGVDYARRMPNGATFVATCRPHNCPDKAAAVNAPDGRLVGAGMVGHQCRPRPGTRRRCDDAPSAFVFVRKGAQGDYARGLLVSWAKSVLVATTDLNGAKTTNRNVQVITIG